MRHLISSLQNHNHQLKGDAQRYKRKLREVQAEIGKVRRLPGKAMAAPREPLGAQSPQPRYLLFSAAPSPG